MKKNKLTSFHFKNDEIEVDITKERWGEQTTGTVQKSAQERKNQKISKEIESSSDGAQPKTINVPMVGICHFKLKGDGSGTVHLDAEFKKGQIVCEIEAMKSFYSIDCPVNLKITRILVSDEEMVEFDQPIIEYVTKEEE